VTVVAGGKLTTGVGVLDDASDPHAVTAAMSAQQAMGAVLMPLSLHVVAPITP
jgi:hypothetical protein